MISVLYFARKQKTEDDRPNQYKHAMLLMGVFSLAEGILSRRAANDPSKENIADPKREYICFGLLLFLAGAAFYLTRAVKKLLHLVTAQERWNDCLMDHSVQICL